MKEIMRLGAILLLICFVAASLLAMTNDVTFPKIMEQRQLANEKARKEVLPDAESFEEITGEQLTAIQAENDKVDELFVGKKDDAIVGYVVKTLPKGFGGTIKIFTGITADGTISGVRMGTGHQETPGLGAKAELPKFYEMYNGMATGSPIGVSKTTQTETEIQAISGATITSQAVTDGVNFAIDAVAALNAQ